MNAPRFGFRGWPIGRVWLLLAMLWFASLPFRELLDPDEGRYAEIPREMLQTNDWVTPRLNGLKYFEKPPLQYWATAALYSVFGVHEWTARLWSALLAFACLPLVYGFCRRLGHDSAIATIAVMLLAINPLFVIVGQINLLDQGFTFFVVLALFSFLIAQRDATQNSIARRCMLLAWAALALAVLSKGIVVLVLFGLSFGAYAIASRDISFLKKMQWLPGLLLFCAITAPWFVLVQNANPEFAEFFFVREHFSRFLTTVHARVQPWWFFPAILLFALGPILWCGRATLRSSWRPAALSTDFQVERFLLIWCAVLLVFFSLSRSKLAPYILPIMPPLAVLFAPVIARDARSPARAAWFVATLLIGIAVGLPIFAAVRDGAIPTSLGIWCSIAVAIGLLAFLVQRTQRQASVEIRWVALATIFIAGFQSLFMAYTSVLAIDSPKTLAGNVSRYIQAHTPVFSVGQYSQSIGFYLRRPLEVFDYRGELDFGLIQSGVVAPRDLQDFQVHWANTDDGIAFIDPKSFALLRVVGTPGRVLTEYDRSVVLSRR